MGKKRQATALQLGAKSLRDGDLYQGPSSLVPQSLYFQ
jgi:hypothetical protein